MAEATADAIRKVAEAIRQPGGEQAVQLKVARAGGRRLRAAGAEEQHDDRAEQHGRGVGLIATRDGADEGAAAAGERAGSLG